MTRAATRSAWGTWIGFETCPALLDRLVERFRGPWTRLEDLPVAVPAPCVPASGVPASGVPASGVPASGVPASGVPASGVPASGDGRTPDGTAATGCVVLAARSLADLRRAVPLRGLLPSATRVRIVLADVPPWAAQPLPSTGPGACWRHLADMRVARRGRGWHLDASFTEPVPAGEVVAHVAHGLFGAPGTVTPVAGLEGAGTAAWRPGDPNVTLAPPGGAVPDRRDAPGCDLLLRAETGGVVPPVDEAVVNPIGFRRHPSLGMAVLTAHRDGVAIMCGRDGLVRLPAGGRVTDVDIARLRQVRGVEVPGLDGVTPVVARIVTALAAAGVPVLAGPGPAPSPDPGTASGMARSTGAGPPGRPCGAAHEGLLGPGLAAALAAVTAEALASDLRREELSIRLRRAALREHGAAACWRRLAMAAGLPVPPPPRVSILLCTRRPEMVPFAIEQMERQRGVTAELIVGLHGFTARDAVVSATRLPTTVIEAPAATPFGEVLNLMAAAASGSLLAKVDDDDWYGPDHLADLLLARHYSGADLVGAAAEFVYLEPLDVTIRRCVGTERFVPLVAGGTMLVTRAAFEAAGGFRPLARTVDGQLLQAVEAAGGRIYRTHGFGYVLRRRSAYGHTWRQPVQSFLASYQEQWRGLVFNELMENGAPAWAEVRT